MTGRVYFYFLLLCLLVTVQRATAQAVFTGGTSQSLTICQDVPPVSINSLLEASVPTTGATVNWTVVAGALHGDLVASYTTTSTGGTLSTTGLTYTPTTGYSGADSFKVQVSDGIDSMTTTIYVTILPLPNAGTITGFSTVCVGSTITLATTGTGGIWSASNSNATVNASGEVTGVTAGTVTISYSLSNICGTSAATHVVTVNSTPSAGTLSGATEICNGFSTTLTASVAGGVWSSSAGSVATVSGAGVVTGIAPGTTIISYTVSSSCGTAVATHIMTVSNTPVSGTISGASTVCQTGAIAVFPSVLGGTWSSSAVAIANVDASGIVTGVSGGTAVISYTISNACGVSVATKPVTVNPLPETGTISGVTTICGGLPTTLTASLSGGTWSSANPAIATVTSGGVVTGVTAGTVVISYSFTNSCGTAAATIVIAVGTPAAGSIVGSHEVCQGTYSTTLTSTSTGGTWSSANPSVANVYPNVDGSVVIGGVSTGSTLISYTVVGTCATSVTTHIITVQPYPTPAPITGVPTMCRTATTTLTGGMPGGGGSWTSANTDIAIVVGPGGIIKGMYPGTATIAYSATNSCGTATATRIVTVTTVPSMAPLTGVTTLCEADTATLYSTDTGGVWSSSGSALVSSFPVASGAAGFVTATGAGTATISYTRTNGCGDSSALRVLTLDPLPVVGTISGTLALCPGSMTTFVPTAPGGAWSTSNPAVAGAGFGGLVNGVSPGTAIISYHVTNSCGTNAAVAIVTVNPLPNAGSIAGGATALCPGKTTVFVNTAPGGVWSLTGGGASSIAADGTFTAVTSGTITISYTVSNSCGTVAATRTIVVRTVAECLAEAPELGGMESGVAIYPNPANGTFNIMMHSAADEEMSVLVSNIAGQKVKELYTTTNKPVSVTLEAPAGIYFVTVRTASGLINTAKLTITQ